MSAFVEAKCGPLPYDGTHTDTSLRNHAYAEACPFQTFYCHFFFALKTFLILVLQCCEASSCIFSCGMCSPMGSSNPGRQDPALEGNLFPFLVNGGDRNADIVSHGEEATIERHTMQSWSTI